MKEKPHYLGHRKRLRERFGKGGAEGFHDYELLELLLTYAIPRCDVKPIAKDLIKTFGSLSGVLDAGQKELDEVKGIGPISAVLIRVIKELQGEYLSEGMKGRDLVSSPQAAIDFARVSLSGLDHEVFLAIYLNTKNRVLGHEIIQKGTVDHTVMYPRRLIEAALKHKAAGIILVHNHPSGYSEPSPEDKRLTQALAEVARPMDLRILDHIVVGKDGYFSFAEKNLLTVNR
jgi:DNA repair protein RadC